MQSFRNDGDGHPASQRHCPAGSPCGGPDSARKLTMKDALDYLRAAKKIFRDRREKYDELLQLMKDFKAQRINTTSVVWRVKVLLKGYPKLILGFNTFLPKGYEITLDNETPTEKIAITFVNRVKTRFQHDEQVYISFLEILSMHGKERISISDVYEKVALLFKEHQDLLEDFASILPEAAGVDPVQHAPVRRNSSGNSMPLVERSSAMPMVRQVHGEEGRAVNYLADRDLGVDGPTPDGKAIMEVDKVQRKHKRDDKDLDCDSKDLDNMQQFPQKRMSAWRGDDCIAEQLQSGEGAEIFGMHPTSGFSFNDKSAFRGTRKGLNSWTEPPTKMGQESLGNGGCLATHVRVDDRGQERDCERDDREKDRDSERERDTEWKQFDKSVAKDSALPKPISELDLSNCQSWNPSYHLLPENHPRPTTTHRTELEASVLNDDWVSVTTASGDCGKKQYDEILFRFEDDRFELDMLLGSLISTIKHVEDLKEKIDNMIKPDSQIHIKDHFTVLNLRCIERLYGGHGLHLLDVVLREKPCAALPVILTRLKQKLEECLRRRSDLNKMWAEARLRIIPDQLTTIMSMSSNRIERA
ncbi:paired amphipathic helix protein Sin3-like 2 isoform X2 [Magnolia sinica]|uniref:paired amphipathic helix protein Sin3-like 2 isoform X2 n=1 Tax=Magnolia sinica TaxID=86752 RepID=UPI00265A5E81|nr:paired amphipathic helix protein Sin3-like 2 isoform X2 [Magnolia sinica]